MGAMYLVLILSMPLFLDKRFVISINIFCDCTQNLILFDFDASQAEIYYVLLIHW